MLGAMQDWELRVPGLLDHAAREYPEREIVTRWADGGETRSDWQGLRREARQLSAALVRLGIEPGDRVATLAMNHGRHLAAWYGVIGMGGIVHTINPRLFDDQLVYIANHAADRVLLYDKAFQPIVDRLRDRLTSIEHYVPFDVDRPGSYPALVAAEDGEFAWHHGSERDPCMLCYTSGTTGDPKGVLYTHRSTLLHAMTATQPWVLGMTARDVALPVVPLFHAACWGFPFAAPLAGAKLVFSQVNDAGVLCTLMNRERVTIAGGVPTVWQALFAHIDATGENPTTLRHISVGGSAAPRAMIARFVAMGVKVTHLWGMTETSPIATSAKCRPDDEDLGEEELLDRLQKQGGAPYGVELCVRDDEGAGLPRDGVTSGRLHVRGPWIVQRYYGADSDCVDDEGWFDTGDVAVIHPDGTMQITDRSKDVIKSGGEWISSVDLENAAMGHPGIAEAAAIAIPHPQWGERPLLLVLAKQGHVLDQAGVLAHLAPRVARWWLPDAVLFVDELPHTATGKLLKTALRARYGQAPSAPPSEGGVA